MAVGVFFVQRNHELVSLRANDGQKKVFSRNALEKEAEALTERGRYEEALLKYQEAIKPEHINYEWEKGYAISGMRRIYMILQDYDAALDKMNWVFENSRNGAPTASALEKKREIEVLKSFQKTGDPQGVRDYLSRYMTENRNEIPPEGYGLSGLMAITTVLRLYNAIGDHDAGIAYIDECVAFFKKQDIEKYGVYKPGRADEAFAVVRAAFEQDKAEGFKGCAHTTPGQPCLGKATQAMIQSRYF